MTIPITTWQFFSACKEILGTSEIQKLYKRDTRQIDRWSCDPDFTVSSQKNPADRIEALLKKLVILGSRDIAVAFVDRLARIVKCRLVEDEQITPDKPDIRDEILDDYPVLTDFHEAIRTGADMAVVRDLERRLITEIQETVAAYAAGADK